MSSRGGGTGEKTAKDVRFNDEVRLRDIEVDRLRDQDSIEGDSEGSKKAMAGHNMWQIFGAKRAEGA